MSYGKCFLIIAVSVLMIGTFSVNAGDRVPGRPFRGLQNQIDDKETRIGDLETNDIGQDSQLGNHEARIDDLETNDATQDGRLDALEQEQDEQNTRLDDLEQQTPAAGIRVYDDTGLEMGILVGPTGSGNETAIFVPDINRIVVIDLGNGDIPCFGGWFFEKPDCDVSGKVYLGTSDLVYKISHDSVTKYYVGQGPIQLLSPGDQIMSVLANTCQGPCTTFLSPSPTQFSLFEATEIQELPYTSVVLPLHYQAGSQ
jgi:hypothetical protein